MLVYPIVIWLMWVTGAPSWCWICMVLSVIFRFCSLLMDFYNIGKKSKGG